MMHVLKNYIQSDTNLIDVIQGKFKEQIIISIAMDDVQYEDEYIGQLELIKPYLSEISFLELLIQKNLMIKYNNSNKIANYLANNFFSDLGESSSIKRIVFKDVLHSSSNKQGSNLYEQLLEFNYQQYIDWVFNFIGVIKYIGEVDLNVNTKFINPINTAVFKQIQVNKLSIYVEKSTNILNILAHINQNTLKFIKVNIKENTILPKEMFEIQYQMFSYLEQEQSQSIQEVVIYNVFDDMLAKPVLNNSFLSNTQSKTLSLLGVKKDEVQNGDADSKNTTKNQEELTENQMKIQMTTKFIESISSFKNLQKLQVNGFLLDLLCLDTIKNISMRKRISRNISQQQSFQDIPLLHSNQSSQIMDWNKHVSQDGSQPMIKLHLNQDDSKNQINLTHTPLSIRLSCDTSNLDNSKTLSNAALKPKKQKSVFKSHAIDGMIFQYSSKIESSRQIEKHLLSSQELVKKNSIIELPETQASSNDSTNKNKMNKKYSNGYHASEHINEEGYLTPTKQGKSKQLPPFVLFPEKQEESTKKFDLDDIPFFSIDSVEPTTIEQPNSTMNNHLSSKIDQSDQQHPTPVFAEIQPEQILQKQQKSQSITPRKSFEQNRKSSQNLLRHQSSKESSFNIDSSIPHTDNQEEYESTTSQLNQLKMQTSFTSNQPIEYKLDQIDSIKCQQYSISLKINHHNRVAAKSLLEYLQPKLKEIQLSLNEYDDNQWQEYMSQEALSSKKIVIQWQYKLMRTPPLKSVEATNIFNLLREKHQSLTSLTLQLTNKKQFCPQTCQALQDFISSHQALKTFNFETCMFPSQMEFYKFLVCIAKSTIRHIEISGPKFEVLSDEANLISPWKSYLNNRLRSLTIIGQNYSLNVLSTIANWKMFRLNIIHLSPTATLPLGVQKSIVTNQYMFGFSHKNLQPNNLAHQCYDKIHTIIVQYTIFSKSFYSILSYSPEITFWDLFFD